MVENCKNWTKSKMSLCNLKICNLGEKGQFAYFVMKPTCKNGKCNAHAIILVSNGNDLSGNFWHDTIAQHKQEMLYSSLD